MEFATIPPSKMKTFREFFQDELPSGLEAGQQGEITDWMPFCDLVLTSGKICVCDPSFAPPQPDMEVVVELPSGRYRVEGRGIVYGSDKRAAALRCLREGRQGERGAVLGEVGVDTGQIGLCDLEVFGAAVEKLGEAAFWERLEELENSAEILEAAPGAILALVDSGFGDGSYEVSELRDGGELVGLEVTLIGPEDKYPFGEDEESENDEEADGGGKKSDDPMGQVFQQMIGMLQEKRTGDKEKDKEALKGALDKMMREQEEKLRPQIDEYRAHLTAQRRAVPLIRTVTRPGNQEVLAKPEVAARRASLEAAGYRMQGVYEFAGIPNFSLVLFVHENGTTASISLGREITTELGAEYPDGRGFYVRDAAAAAGLTPPPWSTYRCEAGKTVPEIIALFNAERPSGHRRETEAEAVARLADGFNRIQQWRLGRGGWNRAEVQAQMGIADPAGHEDQIGDQCLNVREKWLYAWFKEQEPKLGDEMLESLVIVHDELEPSILWFLWVIGGGSARVRKHEFEEETSREAFRRVIEAHGQPMRLLAQKSDGYGADFYGPAVAA